MNSRERHILRDKLARAAGYRPKPVPADVDHAGIRLPEPVDRKAHQAALALRGLDATKGDKAA